MIWKRSRCVWRTCRKKEEGGNNAIIVSKFKINKQFKSAYNIF